MSDALTREELDLLDALAAESIEPIDPPAAIRTRIFAAVRRRQPLDDSVPGEHESLTVRAAEGRWVLVAPGVRTKKLTRDARRGTMTLLLELEPLAIAPAHDHEGGEDSFVIRGSCRIGAISLGEGDFHHVDAGAHHGDVVASEQGCLLLLTVEIPKAA
jgi:anti-sigma factor ChrR (cupin superfamily)